MSANVEAMVREGINAFKAGRKDEARALLLKATELDQYNEQAWLWLSGLMDTPDDQRTCLENVLAINPNNERANQGLSYITGQTSSGNPSPFAASAGAPPTAPSPTAPTSVEWGAAEPPNWTPQRAEPTPAVLDDWVANLNLQGGDPQGDFSFTPNNTTASPFGDTQFGTSPFGNSNADDDLFAEEPFSSMPLEETLLAPSAPPAKRRSPSTNSRPPEARKRKSPTPARTDTSLRFDIEGGQEDAELENSEGGMFGYIPAEIAPTRLPGTVERTPSVLMIGMVLLVVLNVGAALLLMWGLLT